VDNEFKIITGLISSLGAKSPRLRPSNRLHTREDKHDRGHAVETTVHRRKSTWLRSMHNRHRFIFGRGCQTKRRAAVRSRSQKDYKCIRSKRRPEHCELDLSKIHNVKRCTDIRRPKADTPTEEPQGWRLLDSVPKTAVKTDKFECESCHAFYSKHHFSSFSSSVFSLFGFPTEVQSYNIKLMISKGLPPEETIQRILKSFK